MGHLKTSGMMVYIILMLFYCFAILVLSIIGYNSLDDATQEYYNMASNFKESYIVDITSGSSDCAEGYTSISNWDWQGTKDGCDCQPSTYSSRFQYLYEKACNSTQLEHQCQKVVSIPSRQLNFFGSTALSKLNICVKRADDSQAFYKIAAGQTGQCSLKQKTCGNTAKPYTVICVNQGQPCPVYSIVLLQAPDPVTYPSSEWTSQTLPNSGGYLYFNQKGTTASTLPTSELRFTQGDGVCTYDNNAKRLPNGMEKDYILMNTKRESCSATDSTFFEMAISVPENIFYQLNLPSGDFIKLQAQPGNSAGASVAPFKAYRRPFINWDILERYKLKEFIDSEDSIKELKIAEGVYVIVNLIVTLLILSSSIVLVLALFGCKTSCIDGSSSVERNNGFFCYQILTICSKISQIPFLLWAFILSAKKKDLLRSIADSSPSDEIYNNQIRDLATSVEENIYFFNLIAIIIFGIIIFLDIIAFLSTYLIMRYRQKIQAFEQAIPQSPQVIGLTEYAQAPPIDDAKQEDQFNNVKQNLQAAQQTSFQEQNQQTPFIFSEKQKDNPGYNSLRFETKQQQISPFQLQEQAKQSYPQDNDPFSSSKIREDESHQKQSTEEMNSCQLEDLINPLPK